MKISQKIKFGGNNADSDALAAKVAQGIKTATSSLLDYYLCGKKEMGRLGEYASILNSSGEKVAVVRIIKMEIIKFGDITGSFAIAEGDGSLQNWQKIHKAYYSEQLAAIGKELTGNTELVCEWFRLV